MQEGNGKENHISHGRILTSSQMSDKDTFWHSVFAELDRKISELEGQDSENYEIAKTIRGSLRKNIDNEINFYRANFQLGEQEFSWLKKNETRKWADYLIYRYKFRVYPEKKILKEFPPYVLIEPTSVCNIRCVMCFQVDKTFTNSQFMGKMPWNIFQRAVDESAKNDCQAITLASRGEPTLHPLLPDMLAYIHSKGILDLKLNTNATRLSEKIARSILSSEVNELVFSVDAGTKETYERIRVKGKFDQVVANITRFNEIRETEFPDSKTTTRISGVKVDEDQDVEQMVAFWSPLVDEVSIKPAIARWDSYHNNTNSIKVPCSQLWERMYVWYDGALNPCDFDYNSYLTVGNINEMTLSEAWLGARYSALRKAHLAEERSSCFPCDRCPL